MTRYLLRRLAYALVLLLAVVTLNFLLIHIARGERVETLAGSWGGIRV
jgi:peptide/nickel transport system permease protein